jgi:hypothetical protein
MSELTEDQIVKAADILRADEEARYAQTWLWNGADTDYVQDLYFKVMVRRVLSAVDQV